MVPKQTHYMKICAIISAWADTKSLLSACIENIRPVVDHVIVVYSDNSNHFNFNDSITELVFSKLPCQWVKLEPEPGRSPHDNETRKRNFGLEMAKVQGFSHFIVMDADEFYMQDEFKAEKERVEKDNLNGIVCRLKVYIKSPILWCEDHTLVPSIHRLFKNTTVGNFKHYPFNIDEQGNSHIDPCRRINCFDRIQMSEMIMYHYSYVREDINLKIDNSSAKLSRSREVIYEDLSNAKPGYRSKLYHRELKESPNYFNLQL
jgi:hypothetical protein